MESFRSQARREFSNGLVVERLPLGHAAGRWWATFVYTLPGWEGRDPPVDWHSMDQRAEVHDPDGKLRKVGSSGAGTEREYELTYELLDSGAAHATVEYTEGRDQVGIECIALDADDRTGCFSVRLADGSLVERLPVGHVHRTWRIAWVRSGLPQGEVGDVTDQDVVVGMPHERHVRLRTSAGPIDPVGASGSGPSPEYFAIELPDIVRELVVDYLFEHQVVATEAIALPRAAT